MKNKNPKRFAFLTVTDRLCLENGIKLVRRGEDSSVIADWKTRFEHSDGWTVWKFGIPKEYHRAKNNNYVRSFAEKKNRRMIVYRFDVARLERKAPQGHHWDIDGNGLRLVRDSDGEDHHVTGDDLLTHGWATMLVEQLDTLARKRSEEPDHRYRKITEALVRSGRFKVSLPDSLAAGNCAAGTEEWAKRHGFDARRWHVARKVRDADPSNPRVLLVLRKAAARHARLTHSGAELLYPKH